MEYRKADFQDIDILTQMRIEMLCENTDHSVPLKTLIRKNTKEYIAAGMIDNSFVLWIAVLDARIVAMGGVNFFSLPPNDWCPNGKTAYIGNMYTVPAFRKQGIASRLLSIVVDEAISRGCERVLLNTTDMGKPLYERFGFETSPTAMALYPLV